MQLVSAAVIQREQLGAQCRVERPVHMGQHAHATRRPGRQIDQHAIDAIQRRARHQADVEGRS